MVVSESDAFGSNTIPQTEDKKVCYELGHIDPEEVLKTFDEEGTLRELETIQKQQKLNRVFSTDDEGPGGAHHDYLIIPTEPIHEDYREVGIDSEDGGVVIASNSCLPTSIFFQ